jgi:hypothetical protein
MKSMTFDTLVEKVVECEKAFGNKSNQSTGETLCLSQKGKSEPHNYFRGEGIKRECGRKNFRGKAGRHNQGERSNLHYTRCERNGSNEENDYKFPWKKIKYRQNQKEDKGKTSDLVKGKTLEFTHYIVSHCNIGVNKDLFNTSFSSWIYAWLLDTSDNYHTTF